MISEEVKTDQVLKNSKIVFLKSQWRHLLLNCAIRQVVRLIYITTTIIQQIFIYHMPTMCMGAAAVNKIHQYPCFHGNYILEGKNI